MWTRRTDGLLRPIVGCQWSYQLFRTPQTTRLFSGAGFSEVFQTSASMWTCRGGDGIGVNVVDGMKVFARRRVQTQLQEVPMGWIWAPTLVQVAREHILDKSLSSCAWAVAPWTSGHRPSCGKDPRTRCSWTQWWCRSDASRCDRAVPCTTQGAPHRVNLRPVD